MCSSYGNANQDALAQALQDQANLDGVVLPTSVKTILDSWTFKMGYPVIKITRNYQTGAATATQVILIKIRRRFGEIAIVLTVVQDRFLLRKSANSNDTTVYRWWVQLTYQTPSNPKSRQWMTEAQTSAALTNLGASANQWVVFNVDQQSWFLLLI